MRGILEGVEGFFGGEFMRMLNLFFSPLFVLLSISNPLAFADDETMSNEIVFGSKKYCIYTSIKDSGKKVATTTCSVAKADECPSQSDCDKDKNISPKTAKAEDPADRSAKNKDGATCAYPKNLMSVDTVFCSTAVRCTKDDKVTFGRANCMGTVDPDNDKQMICPGLSVCFGAQKMLPRPPVKDAQPRTTGVEGKEATSKEKGSGRSH